MKKLTFPLLAISFLFVACNGNVQQSAGANKDTASTINPATD